jgi:hypothetical protein
LTGIHGSVGAFKSLVYKIHDPDATRKTTEQVRLARKEALTGVAGSVGARKSLQYLSTKTENLYDAA